MTFEIVGLAIVLGGLAFWIWRSVKNYGVATKTLYELAELRSELASLKRERLIEANSATPVRPPLATAPDPITTLPLRIAVPAPVGSVEVPTQAFPKPIKVDEGSHHSGPPSPMYVPPAFPKPIKKVDEDWPQHD